MLCALALGSSVNFCVTSVNTFAKWSFININVSVSSRLMLTVSLTGSSNVWRGEPLGVSVRAFLHLVVSAGKTYPNCEGYHHVWWSSVRHKKTASQELAFSIVHFLNEGTVRTAASCHHPLSATGLPPQTLNQNETFFTQTVFLSIFYCSNMKINKCRKLAQEVGLLQ